MARAIVSGKSMNLNAYIRKKKRAKFSDLCFCLKKLERKEQINFQVNRKKYKNKIQ